MRPLETVIHVPEIAIYLRNFRRREIVNKKVLAATEMKARRDTEERKIFRKIEEHLGVSHAAEAGLKLEITPNPIGCRRGRTTIEDVSRDSGGAWARVWA